MKIILHKNKNGDFAELITKLTLSEVQDFLDLMANANYKGAEKIIIHKDNLHPDFFELKTKLAGEVLQKFSTYRQKLAIVGDFSVYESKNLKDFISESNKIGHIIFVGEVAEAMEKL